jgi:hypothetical protein
MFPTPEGMKVVDTDNNGDGKSKPFSNPKKDVTKKKFEPVMVPDQVYNASQSKNGGIVNNGAFPLSYGSAEL